VAGARTGSTKIHPRLALSREGGGGDANRLERL